MSKKLVQAKRDDNSVEEEINSDKRYGYPDSFFEAAKMAVI